MAERSLSRGRQHEFRVLGPMDVVIDDNRVPLGQPGQRALLGVLALHAGQVVGTDALVDALWRDRPPDSAANILQVYITRLRAVLEPERLRGATPRLLVTRAPGYVLNVGHDQVDALRFERLVGEARHAAPRVAVARLTEALALWRGPVLADVSGRDVVRAQRARLDSLRRQAVDARLEAALELGQHIELIGELEALVVEDPSRERTWGQLMVALYRSGWRADALAAYDRVRRVLADELGLDPGIELRALRQAILRQDATLGAVAQATAPVRNFPTQLTSFIGRRAELAHLRGLLDQSRLVTLVGAGGCGKSQLALHIAAAVDGFRDGVWLVDLSALEPTAHVATTLAEVLGVRTHPGWDTVGLLSEHLRRSSALIVLDNCERVVDACADLAATVLARCPGVRIVATSREALAIPGELTWRVPPLAELDAMLLFADRGAATGGFELTPRTTPIVNVICRRLDANPLAIEMAAAQLATLSVQEVAERLDDRFSLLSLARRGVPARHRTLQAVVEWSYHLLDERERALFDRLSWFEGEFTIAAAEAAEASGTDTAAVLGRLVHKSLVQRIDRSDGPARYALSETLRHFGRHVVAGGHPISRSTG